MQAESINTHGIINFGDLCVLLRNMFVPRSVEFGDKERFLKVNANYRVYLKG